MPKKSKEKKVLHVAKAWRNYGTKTKDGGHVIERREQMVFIERDDVDGHCQGAWHDQEHRYWAGVASSGRAECRKCGTKIAKDALRIGTPRKMSSGLAGYIANWNHLECCRVEGLSTAELAPLVYWEDGVSDEQRKTVLDTLTADSVPECAQAIDPAADAFMGTQAELSRATPPKALKGKLLPFQEKGLGWMVQQELGEYKGGILADDMGLGKTIQTISLLLDAKAKAKERVKAAAVANDASSAASTTASSAASTTASSAASASSVDAAVGGSTLVVAPTSALIQWSEEIVKFAGDELSVLIYYDKRAGMTIDELKSHDVVLTTYQIAEHEWRSEDNLTKLPCIHCEKYFQPDKLKWHNMYQCGPDAQRTTKQMKTERKAGGSSSPATGARVPTEGVGDTIDFNLGGLPFLQGAAAPDPSLSSAAAAAAAKKRSPAATPAEDPAAAAAASKQKQKQKDDAPRTITDCYRKYMHEAGREPVKMYEAAHRARARQWDSNAAAAAAAADGGGSSDDDDSTQSGEAAGAPAAVDSSAPAAAAAADASQSLQSPNIKLEPGDKQQPQQPQQRDEEPEMIDIDDCPEPWVCNSCTLNNSGYLDYCEVCGAQKVALVVDSGAGASSSPPAAAAAAAAAAPIAGSSPALEIEIKDEVDVASGGDDAEPSSKAKAKPKQTKAKGAQGKSKTKAGAAKKRKAKKKKVEGSPKKGMSSYFHYTAASRPEFKSQHPDATVQELAKLMGAAWKQLTAEAKQPFESLAAKDKERYQNEKAAWDITHPEETPPPEAPIKAEEDAEGGGGGAPANASNSGENENDENDDDDDDDDFEPVPKRMRAASEAAANGTSKGKGKAGKGKGGGAAKRKKAEAAAGGDGSGDDDLEICHPTMSQYNIQTDSSDKPMAWGGTDLGGSKLHSIVWERIVLDEAHKIKGRTTNVAKAIFALRSAYKWCLSGTPLQNNVGELWALVRFLKMHPYAYYFCKSKGCDCRMESWPFRNHRSCRNGGCRHRSFSHYSYFNTNIVKPIQSNGFSGTGKEAMLKLRNEVLYKLQLRRTKAIVGKEINLPPLTVKVVKIQIRDDERDFYEGLYKQQKLSYDTFAEKGTVLNNYAHIFELLGRMRQACDHPSLIVHGTTKPGDRVLPAKTRTEEVGDLCGICTDLVDSEEVAMAKCGHVFHHECIESYLEEVAELKQQKPTCPTCHKALTVTMKLHEGADATAKSEEEIKKDLNRLARETDSSSGGKASPTQQQGQGGSKRQKKQQPSEQQQPAAAAAASASASASFAGGGEEAEEAEEDSDDSDDEEAELARAMAMSLAAEGEGEGAEAADDGGPADDPDEDMQNAGNELDEIDHEDLMLGAAAGAGGGAAAASGAGDDDSDDDFEDGKQADAKQSAKKPKAAEAKKKKKGKKGKKGEGGGGKVQGVTVGRSNFMSRIDTAHFKPSSKLTAVVNAIVEAKESSKDKAGKSICFSQFINMLDLVEWQLRKSGLNPVKLVGTMPPAQRAATLNAFKTNPKVDVILLSLRAGGEGLNLQCATHVFLLDPWWNPAVEMQAIQRAHRIGQTQAVEARRFCVVDTIEDDMLKIQEKKRLVFEGTVDGKTASMAKLSLKDLAFFFKN